MLCVSTGVRTSVKRDLLSEHVLSAMLCLKGIPGVPELHVEDVGGDDFLVPKVNN
jgi:hypothetical protein